MKDIKIRITKKSRTIDIITRALNIGYNMPLINWEYFTEANFILIREHKLMAWCTEEIFNSDMSEEMSFSQFMSYGR
jgi:hypothetical protein